MASPLSADLIAKIHTAATDQFEYSRTACTPELKAATDAHHAKFVTDEEFKATEMAGVATSFAAADVNGDGMLDFDEYTNWMAHF